MLFLLYDDQANNDESPEMMARWFAVDGETVAAGVNMGGEALYPVGRATESRWRGRHGIRPGAGIGHAR